MKQRAFLLLGNGSWAQVYHDTIERNKGVCERISAVNNDTNCIYQEILEKSSKYENATLIIATNPILQSKLLQHLHDCDIPTILEKPLAYDYKSYNIISKRCLSQKGKTLAGFYNLLKPGFSTFRKFVLENHDQIQSITILEGSTGPNRRTLSNFYDWFPHIAASLQSVGLDNFSAHHIRDIQNDKKGFELTGSHKNIFINARFGINFSRKKREIMIKDNYGRTKVFDFTEISKRKRREVDKLLNISWRYFCDMRPIKIYSASQTNDEFMIENAKITYEIGKLLASYE